jgi:hypothetical protein
MTGDVECFAASNTWRPYPGFDDLVQTQVEVAGLVQTELVVADLVQTALVVADFVQTQIVEADLVQRQFVVADFVRKRFVVVADLVRMMPPVLVGIGGSHYQWLLVVDSLEGNQDSVELHAVSVAEAQTVEGETHMEIGHLEERTGP